MYDRSFILLNYNGYHGCGNTLISLVALAKDLNFYGWGFYFILLQWLNLYYRYMLIFPSQEFLNRSALHNMYVHVEWSGSQTLEVGRWYNLVSLARVY